MKATPNTIYVSGPMTGLPGHNFPAFNRAAAALRSVGWNVVNPAELDDPTENDWDQKPWDFYLRRDLVAMMPCTAIYLLDGWARSKGARLEYDVASRLGMTVFNASPIGLPRPLQPTNAQPFHHS